MENTDIIVKTANGQRVETSNPFPVTIVSGGNGGGGSTIDRELVVSTYTAKNAFTGASIGDTITCTQVIDVTSTPSTVSTIWRNQTTGADLASPPAAVNLTLVGSQALTDTQLRATAVPISNTALTNIDVDLGAPADAAASTDTGSFSIIALIKRGMQNWTTLLARIPALVSGRIPVDGSGVTQPVSGPLTDAQLRAVVVPVAPNITRGSGIIDANTQRVTLATDGQTVTSLTSIDAKIPTLINGRQPVNSSVPQVTSGTILALTTNASGTPYTAFASQACTALDIVNNTGVTIEYRRGATGSAMQIPTGAARMIIGITNASQIDVRRTDVSNTTVTIQAEAFTV